MNHIDLFSGIGGFAYAFREVFGGEGETVLFCDNDKYCQAVLRKHWSEAPIWSDIRKLIADAKCSRPVHGEPQKQPAIREQQAFGELVSSIHSPILLTGGFPCQPFSQAGKRRGKSDDRFLWPEMLECIRLFKPAWVIAENVYGILNIEGGMVFEQVCSDMEKEGYEVWPFIIPACGVNAPHRRDRVWFVGYSSSSGTREQNKRIYGREYEKKGKNRKNIRDGIDSTSSDAPITTSKRLEGKINQRGQSPRFNRKDWQANWKEVAFRTCVCGVDDGIPRYMDGVRISQARHRTERIKMLGNAIVPQVAMEIMKVIRDCDGCVQ